MNKTQGWMAIKSDETEQIPQSKKPDVPIRVITERRTCCTDAAKHDDGSLNLLSSKRSSQELFSEFVWCGLERLSSRYSKDGAT